MSCLSFDKVADTAREPYEAYFIIELLPTLQDALEFFQS